MGFIAGLLMVGTVYASGTAQTIEAAKEALKNKDTQRAFSLLTQARHSFPREPKVIDAAFIGEFIYLEGLAPRVAGIKRERDLDKFRDALSIYPQLQWNRDIIDDKEMRGYFEALRAEVQQREARHTSVPEKRGALKAFVDGVEHRPNQAVRSGPHLAQVKCPDGQVFGQWFDFESELDWVSLCKDPVDLSVASDSGDDDFMDLMDRSPLAGPEPLAWKPAPTKKKRVQVEITPKALFISAGAAGLISIASYAAALASRAEYDETGAGAIRTRDELSKKRSSTNTLVGVSVGSAVVGGGLAIAGVVKGKF